MLYFPPLVCKLLCYCSNTSGFYFSSQDIKYLFTRTVRCSLTFKSLQLILNVLVLGQRKRSNSGQSLWNIFTSSYDYCCGCLAIFLWIYRLVLFLLQKEIEKIVAVAWNIFQPFLFGLIGAGVSITSLRPETVGKLIHKLSSFHYWLWKNLYKEIENKADYSWPQKTRSTYAQKYWEVFVCCRALCCYIRHCPSCANHSNVPDGVFCWV